MVIEVKGNKGCRLGNWLYWIFSLKNYDMSNDVIKMISPSDYDVLENLNRIGVNIIIDESIEFDDDYKQNQDLFDFEKLRNQISIPNDVEERIYKTIPDICDRVCINVRRGDYLTEEAQCTFPVLTEEYIMSVYKKYYDGMKVLVISDDKEWCENNLKKLFDDVVVYHFDDILCDLFSIVLSKAVVCSCSSFSLFGAYLNKNNDCVVPYPYYKNSTDDRIVPYFSKRENCTDEMLMQPK